MYRIAFVLTALLAVGSAQAKVGLQATSSPVFAVSYESPSVSIGAGFDFSGVAYDDVTVTGPSGIPITIVNNSSLFIISPVAVLRVFLAQFAARPFLSAHVGVRAPIGDETMRKNAEGTWLFIGTGLMAPVVEKLDLGGEVGFRWDMPGKDSVQAERLDARFAVVMVYTP